MFYREITSVVSFTYVKKISITGGTNIWQKTNS